MLITGGLLALGIVAMIGAVLLAMGGQREKSKLGAGAVRARTVIEPASDAPTTVEATTPQLGRAENAGKTDLISSESLMLEQYLRINEQFAELIERLEAMQERSIAIEQRLERISAMVGPIEEGEPTLVGVPAIRQRYRRNA
jgi:hypothetical protein